MDYETLLQLEPYAMPRGQKAVLYGEFMTGLTRLHRDGCPKYARLLEAMGCGGCGNFREETVPMLPVSLFKDLELCSVSAVEVFKTLTSSGTSGQRPSKIFLDRVTAAAQQRVLSRIVSSFIGEKRLPLLIIDSPAVLRERSRFSARGAGVRGFSMFASRTCCALDEELRLDLAGVRRFLDGCGDGPVLLFGFTYLVWRYFIQALESRGERLDIPGGMLIHGGGWKKLLGEAVSPERFKDGVRTRTGVMAVSDYYGMAEQTGCVCMECPQGHLHVSVWSDVLFRRAEDYGLCAPGEPGIVQVLSPLPLSYPGHSLLTEDMGVLLGEDDCPCGRLGKYFAVTGRVPRAEIRGCSDTYES